MGGRNTPTCSESVIAQVAVKKNGHESVPENNGVLGTLPIPHTVSYGLRGVPGVLCIAVRTLHGDLQVSIIIESGKEGVTVRVIS